MAPFKLSFGSRKPVNGGFIANDENANPNDARSPYGRDKPSVALNVKERKDEPNEFKLSSVNDSGEYLPPSPVEKRSFWGKSPSSSSTAHRSVFDENEPFSISRESFDSYRRSFDISGRSPIVTNDSFTSRASLDSRRRPRPVMTSSTFEQPPPAELEETTFEEVGLNDDKEKQQPRKRGFLSRFAESNGVHTTEDGKHHFNLLHGRKRGQSGSGSELNSMQNQQENRPSSKGRVDGSVRS